MKNYAKLDEVLYHIGFAPKAIEGAELAILPGDPGRVEFLAKALGENASFVACHREYTSWITEINGCKVLVCSTGMGGPAVGICLEELARVGIKKVIRVGTTGSIQPEIALGDVIIDKASVRLDGTSTHYAPVEFPAVADFELTMALAASAKNLGIKAHLGIAVSSDTFYPGQERYDSFTGYVPRRFQGTLKEWQALGAANYEMETSALFVVSQALGIKAAALCGVVAQRTESEAVVTGDFYNSAMEKIVKIIQKAEV